MNQMTTAAISEILRLAAYTGESITPGDESPPCEPRHSGMSIVHTQTAHAAHMAGYAFEFALEPGSGRIMYTQKGGVNTGVKGVLRYYPDTGTVVAILTAQDFDVWNMANDVHEAIKELSIS